MTPVGADQIVGYVEQSYSELGSDQKIQMAKALTPQITPYLLSLPEDQLKNRRLYRDCKRKFANSLPPDIKPSGFLFGGFIFSWILQGVISWIIHKILERMFAQEIKDGYTLPEDDGKLS